MTALIKQLWSDEMIPARVGDVVDVKGYKNCPMKITLIGSGMISCDAPNGFLGFVNVPTEWCTLISRPFNVGDKYEMLWNGFWVSGLPPVCEHIVNYMNKKPECYRHTNPLWRTKEED
jgi:hypothetical protein